MKKILLVVALAVAAFLCVANTASASYWYGPPYPYPAPRVIYEPSPVYVYPVPHVISGPAPVYYAPAPCHSPYLPYYGAYYHY
jgi:hypothetical protein